LRPANQAVILSEARNLSGPALKPRGIPRFAQNDNRPS
jgi:hypothetical protein